MKKCDHTWGETFYDPLFYGKPTCFSGPPHVDRFRIFCTRCGLVKTWKKGDADWEESGHLPMCVVEELVQQRAVEVLEGRIEVCLGDSHS